MPNILIKYSKDGKVSYQAIVRVDTKRPVKKTFETPEEAEAWRVAKDAELRALKETPAYEFSLSEVLEDFSQFFPAKVTDDFTASVYDFLQLAVVTIEIKHIENLSETDMDTLEQVIEHARRYMGVVVRENVVTCIRAKRANLPYRPITEFEEEALISGSAGLANGSLQDVIILALDTALAQQEILDLTTANVDISSNVIRMSDTRVIELTPRAKSALVRRLASNQSAIFPDAPKNTVQTAFLRLRNKLGFNGPDFNDMRKIAIRRMSEKMSISELKDALGYARYDSLEWLIELQRK